MERGKSKRVAKLSSEDDSLTSDHASDQLLSHRVAKISTRHAVKRLFADIDTSAEADKPSATKRRRAYVAKEPEVACDTLHTRKRCAGKRAAKSLQKDEEKKTDLVGKVHSLDMKPIHTRMRKVKGESDIEQLDVKPQSARKETTKVKCKSLPLLPVKVEETSVKTEILDFACSLSAQHSSRKFVGAHVSIAGGLWNAIKSTTEIGGSAMGLFLRSQRTWHCKPLDDNDAELFKETLKESGIDPWMVVPHGSYLLNCGSSDGEVLRKTRETLVDEVKRCEKLGIPIYNFHPGSSKGETSREVCMDKIAESINYVHSQTSRVITVVENMSCQGNTIGGKFSELRHIIDGVADKSRIGVCLDTCHAFAAGYDIRSEKGYEQMKVEFEEEIGRSYLKAVHLNDSKGALGCHLDRHENIGRGKLGLATFQRIMNDPFFDNVPMILETPECDYKEEIQKLYKLMEK